MTPIFLNRRPEGFKPQLYRCVVCGLRSSVKDDLCMPIPDVLK